MRGQGNAEDRFLLPEDALYAAAYRVARFAALISAATLQEELGIDRARAQALLDRLAERGIVGPVVFPRTGARESRVNMVDDLPPAGSTVPPAASPDRWNGLRAAGATGAGAAAGTAVAASLMLTDLGVRLVQSLMPVPSTAALASIAGVVVSGLVGAALAAAVELAVAPRLARRTVPEWARTVRQAVWTIYLLIVAGLGTVLLFRP